MKNALRQIVAFDSLDDAAWAKLDSACSAVIHVDALTDLTRERQRTEYLYMFLSGWGCRYGLFSDGGRHISTLLLPGDAANLDVLGETEPEYGVAALTPASVVLLSVPRLKVALERDLSLARTFLGMTLRENSASARMNVALARFTAREQLANLLCDLASRLVPEPAGFYMLPLTQADMADVLGLSNVHINRTLQMLRAEGLIHLVGRRLEILDWSGLASAGQFHAARGAQLAMRMDNDEGGFEPVGTEATGVRERAQRVGAK